jgi:hypothetical protein
MRFIIEFLKNVRMRIVSKKFSKLPNSKHEKWYGTQYVEVPFTPEQLKVRV